MVFECSGRKKRGELAFDAESVSVASPIHSAPFSHWRIWSPETGNLSEPWISFD